MGTWGSGNFENDCAADHLFEVCSPLLKQIESAMEDPSCLEPDEPDSDIVTANLEILACLSENLGRTGGTPLQQFLKPCVLPAAETIAQWKRKYLEVWDGYIDELDPVEDYKKNRRETIVATFDRVERLARSGH